MITLKKLVIFAFAAFFAWSPLIAKNPKIIWVDSFNSSKNNTFPANWQGRTSKAKNFYRIKAHKSATGENKRYLEANAINSDELIAKTQKVDLVKYPYLNWRWRVRLLPPGGNESLKPVCDSAASLYVIVRAKTTMGIPTPESITYTWSSTLRPGTITKSPYSVWPSRCDIIVLRSGSRQKNKWITEKRNVLADYKKFYKKVNPRTAVIDGVAIMSDSDNTKSQSWADYDEIYFSSK